MEQILEDFKSICDKYKITDKSNWVLDNALLNLIYGLEYYDAWKVINRIGSWLKAVHNEHYTEIYDYFVDLVEEIDWSNDYDY